MDVAIIGAGPAGCRAAERLAVRGARVTLFDPSHPREKPCGGGVTGRALALVANAVRDVPVSVIQTARFTDSGRGESAIVALDDRGPTPASALLVASRSAFDAALYAAAIRAGATAETSRVTRIEVDAGGARLSTTRDTRRADFVIGADGANSLLRRTVARPFRRDQISIATGFFAGGVTSDEIVIEFLADPPGYIWSFPRPDHLAIGVCAQADAGVTSGDLRARTSEWIRATRIAGQAPLSPYSWPIPSLRASDLHAQAVAGERWCLLGDAAGLVDPITREGIYFALASGDWAADALMGAAAGRTYAARVRDEAVPELARAARLKAGFFRPAFTGLLMRALQQSPAVRGVVADLVAGRQSYATLRWRLLSTLEFGLAWRVLRERRRPWLAGH
ncbi:MAG: geranylgeranyl reductase family protein [Acidobacteria bacterium]|nr:geranylgeranyl reductase family protein [Acidobacteriota bacterium]